MKTAFICSRGFFKIPCHHDGKEGTCIKGTVRYVNVTDKKQRENVGSSGIIGPDVKIIYLVEYDAWYATLADTGPGHP